MKINTVERDDKGAKNKAKKRELYELKYTEIVKSGSIRLLHLLVSMRIGGGGVSPTGGGGGANFCLP